MDAAAVQRRNAGASGRSLPLRVVATAIATAMAAVALPLLGGCGSAPVRPSDASRPERVGVPTPDADGGRVAGLASKFVGAPYRYGGAAPGGFDCSGLVWYVHRELGISVPRTAAEQRAAAAPVPRERLQPGDLVFFYTPQDHVGIYLGDGEFVHAPATGRRVERARIDSPFFILAFAGGGRFAR
jgi:cell wall-associated NlpC family hydrolase